MLIVHEEAHEEEHLVGNDGRVSLPDLQRAAHLADPVSPNPGHEMRLLSAICPGDPVHQRASGSSITRA